MKCCDKYPVFVSKSKNDLPFLEMKVIERYNWCYLLRCDKCGQKWISDEFDKGQRPLSFKVEDNDIQNRMALDKKYRRMMVVEQCGGETNEKCIWKDCDGMALKNMKICVDHLMKW